MLVTVGGLGLVTMVTPARAADLISEGYSGTFSGTRTLWQGTVPAYYEGHATVVGDFPDPSGNDSIWPSVGWVCGTFEGYRDFIGTRSFLINSGLSASAKLDHAGASRFCSFVWRSEGSTKNVHIASTSVTLHEVGAPPGPTAAPSASGSVVPSGTPDPSASMCPPLPSGVQGPVAPWPYCYVSPSATPQPSAEVCFEELDPGEFGPPAPSVCPSPPPSAGCFETGGIVLHFATSGGGTGVTVPSCSRDLVDGKSFRVRVTGLDGSGTDPSAWAQWDTYKSGASWPSAVGGAYWLPAESVFTSLQGQDNGTRQIVKAGQVNVYPTQTTADSGWVRYNGPTVSGTVFIVTWPRWYASGNVRVEMWEVAAGVDPLASPTPGPSASGDPGEGTGPCYATAIGANGNPFLVEVPCPAGDGGDSGSGGSGGGSGQGSCTFPDGSLNPLDYFGWIGCNVIATVRAIGELPHQISLYIYDLLVPPDGAFEDMFDTYSARLDPKVPFVWIDQLNDELQAATQSGVQYGPPTPQTYTFGTGAMATTVDFNAVFYVAGTYLAPYRPWLAAAIWFFALVSLFRNVNATIGGSVPSKGGGS
jgi:hypothetical protein